MRQICSIVSCVDKGKIHILGTLLTEVIQLLNIWGNVFPARFMVSMSLMGIAVTGFMLHHSAALLPWQQSLYFEFKSLFGHGLDQLATGFQNDPWLASDGYEQGISVYLFTLIVDCLALTALMAAISGFISWYESLVAIKR